jgi:hypothetical protein
MAVLGLGLVLGALPAAATIRPARDSTSEASRAKRPARTPASTTPSSTVVVKPSSTTAATAAKPAPARSQVPQVELPTTTSRLPAPVSGAPVPSAGSGGSTSTTTGPANPHVVENGEEPAPAPTPASGQAASTTTSTEVSNPVVGNIGTTGPKPVAPVNRPPRQRPARALGATGASTRPLLMLGGGSFLLGAAALAFGEPGQVRTTGAPRPGTSNRRARRGRPGRRVRGALPGWESGVPLAPERRKQVRRRIQRRRRRSPVSRPGAAPGA